MILSTALIDTYFSHTLIYFLLSNYFIEEKEYDDGNQRIQNLLTKVICLCRPRFLIENLIPGLNNLDIEKPFSKVREFFKIYFPIIRSAPLDRVKYLQEAKMPDKDFLQEMYMSSLNFWSDIMELARAVDHSQDKELKRKFIIDHLKRVNKNLPSLVFIPSLSKYSFY